MSKHFFDSTKIICEGGKNFITKENTNVRLCLDEAKNLAFNAKEVGADAIKFQTHVFEDEQHKRHPDRHEWIKKNEALTPYDDFWKPLYDYCKKIGILFMTTPMSRLAAEKVNDLVEVWKIGSADIVDMDLLEYVRASGKPIIASTGMSTQVEIEKLKNFLNGSDYALLHCVSLYPCPVEKLNLRMIKDLQRLSHRPVGFSDHSEELIPPVIAIELGAVIIEKHFTLDRTAWGPDHKFSLEGNRFAEMVKMIREASIRKHAMGEISGQIIDIDHKNDRHLCEKFRYDKK